MKSSSNVYITDENTKDSTRNTSPGIEAKIFLHDAISRFLITHHNFSILQCTDMKLPPNDSPVHGDQINVWFLYSTSDGLLDRSDQLQAVILRFSMIRI